ncbi:MAG TPA: L,D-transpeptidase [Rudaea sp.]|nr:L,D-transpeptidase [Rudaea sp.]
MNTSGSRRRQAFSSPARTLAPALRDASARRLLTVLRVLAFLLAALAWRNLAAAAIDPDPGRLARGEFVWHPEIAPSGPVVIVVSLDEQRAYVYRNGIGIGVSTISSGKKGHETPAGVFSILQRETVHYSNKYDDAPMPFMERLTWDGVAMHGGTLPGYPASHGCIRLPQAFARKLFEITARGTTVVVADGRSAPAAVVHPAVLAPVTAAGDALQTPQPDPEYTWLDDAGSGPISILVSTASAAVFVFRDGRLIATTHFRTDEPDPIGGSVLYVMGEGVEYVPSALDPSRPRRQWFAYPLPTRDNPQPRLDDATTFHVPAEFSRRVYDLLVPGTTVLVTDLPATRGVTAGKATPLFESSGPGRRPR